MNEILLMIGDLPVRVSDALIGLGVLALTNSVPTVRLGVIRQWRHWRAA